MPRYASKTDDNHDEIRTAFRKVGAVVVDTYMLKNAFDMLVAFRGELYIVEVKDGEKPPSKQKLTPGEIDCMNNLKRAGVDYHIVTSTDEAMELIGVRKKR